MSFFYVKTCQNHHFSDRHPMPGPTLYFRTFRKLNSSYRRRCDCCFDKFIEESCFGSPFQGYATKDDSLWVCLECTPHYAKGLVLEGRPKENKVSAESLHPRVYEPATEG